MKADWAAGLIRWWVAFYTGGLPAQIRLDRRDEIESDLWSQTHEAAQSGRADRSLAAEMILRLIIGIPADLSWRADQSLLAKASPALEPMPRMRFRAITVMALLGGLGWTIWPIPQAIIGDWTAGTIATWILFITAVLGTFALAGATIGLALTFQDKIRTSAAAIGSIGASVGALGVMGFYLGIIALPVGSAVLIWDLKRLGVISSGLSKAHVAAAALAVVALMALVVMVANSVNLTASAAIAMTALVVPYGLSWIALARALRAGVAIPEARVSGN